MIINYFSMIKLNLVYMKNYVFILIALITFSSYCQKTDSEQILRHTTSITSFDFRSTKLVGSSYINENFLPAKISNNDNIYLIRYNAHMDEMEGNKNDKPYHLVKSMNYTILFEGINKSYRVYNYEEKNEVKPRFFVVLFNGDKISLLLQEKIKFYEEVKPRTGYEKYQPPTLKRLKDKLFIGFKDNSARELPNKKSKFLALFTDKSSDIESYVKRNKLSFKNTEDLIKIFSYYNSLN